MTSLLDKLKDRLHRRDRGHEPTHDARGDERALDDVRDAGAKLEEGFGDTLDAQPRSFTD